MFECEHTLKFFCSPSKKKSTKSAFFNDTIPRVQEDVTSELKVNAFFDWQVKQFEQIYDGLKTVKNVKPSRSLDLILLKDELPREIGTLQKPHFWRFRI